MRRLWLIFILLAALLGVVLFFQEENVPASPATAPTATRAPERIVAQLVHSEAPSATSSPSDARILSVYDNGQIVQMALEEFLTHVVAGEMPALYEPEALRAQAVAARSYTAWKLPDCGGSGCSLCPGADVCTDSQHCMAFLSESEMREKWGADYERYHERIAAAVRDTRGEILTYGGQPIQALFHSASAGRTEDAQAVWGSAVPYLTSVTSQEQKTQSQTVFSLSDLAERLNKAFPGANLTAASLPERFSVKSHTAGGRADVVAVGRVTATGKAVRTALNLSSANFTLSFADDRCTITCTGSGHGVGMSQAGANAMAQEGDDYRAILAHYYPGTQIAALS